MAASLLVHNRATLYIYPTNYIFAPPIAVRVSDINYAVICEFF